MLCSETILACVLEKGDARALCAGMSTDELKEEIEDISAAAEAFASLAKFARPSRAVLYRRATREHRDARAALETERDRRSHEAAIATLPEERR